MAVIDNKTGHDIIFEAYTADKDLMTQSAPVIPSGLARYVNTEHVGSAEYFFLLAFYTEEGFSAPPGIGIIQGVHGGGGGVTIFGFGASARATVTTAYAQPVAACKVGLHEQWTLSQPGGPEGELIYSLGGDATPADLCGW